MKTFQLVMNSLWYESFSIWNKLPKVLGPNLVMRCISNTETLEPINLSYATYENTNLIPHNQAYPLIIMHGLFGSKSNWNSLCKVYQKKTDPARKIIAADLRNHGDSAHNENHTYAHMAADIKALFEKLNIAKASLMGHSMGGRAVMLFALKYPELVDRLIAVDISPVTTSPTLNSTPRLFQALETVNLPVDISMSQARSNVDSQLSNSIPNKLLRSFLLTNLIQKDNGSYDWRVNIPALLSNFNNIASFPLVSDLQYKGPVLFLGGGESDFIQNISFSSRNKSFQQANFIPNEENLDLAYAAYQSTASYSEIYPEPTPLIILHGLMGSKNNWNTFCKKIHAHNRCKVIAVDARNHGESPYSKLHSYDNLVVDIRQFLEKRGLKSIHLLGHSMGGRTAMLFALKYPELVEKLIVVDASPISTSSSLKQIPKLLKSLEKLKLPQNVSLSDARKLVLENLLVLIKNKGVVTFLITNLVQKTEGSYGWRFNLKALLENFDHIASFPEIHNSTYDGPVLFMGGAKSDHIQKSDYPRILKLFPNAHLKYIEGAGHWVHSEKPEEFLRETLNFLNTNIVK